MKPGEENSESTKKGRLLGNLALTVASVLILFAILIAYGYSLIDQRFEDMNTLLEQAAKEHIWNRDFHIQAKISLLKQRIRQMSDESSDFFNESKIQHLIQADEYQRQAAVQKAAEHSFNPAMFLSGIVRIAMGKSWHMSYQRVEEDRGLEEAYHYERTRQYSRAITLYEQLLENGGFARLTMDYIRLHLGFCYAMIAQFDDAKNNFVEILNQAPRPSLRSAAVSLLEFAVFLEREIASLKTTAKDPLDLAESFYYFRDFKQAIPILNEELSRQTATETRQRIYYFLGRSYEEQGDTGRALDAYTVLMLLKADTSWAKLANRRLYIIGKFYEKNDTLASTAQSSSAAYKDDELFQRVEDLVKRIPISGEGRSAGSAVDVQPGTDQGAALLDNNLNARLEEIRKNAEKMAEAEKTPVYRIQLVNGTTLIGSIVRQSGTSIILKTTAFGTRTISRADIISIRRQD